MNTYPVPVMVLSDSARRFCYGELYVEASINILQGFVSLTFPYLSLSPLAASSTTISGETAEVARWFGALNFALGGVLLFRALRPFEPRALKVIIEALLVGDILYLGAFTPWAVHFGAWPGSAAPYALTAVMFVSRAVLLIYEDWRAAARVADAAGTAEGAAFTEL